MRKDVYNYIVSKKDLQHFLREQPIWYQELSRRPWKLKQFEQAAMKYYKKTIPDRVEKSVHGDVYCLYDAFYARKYESVNIIKTIQDCPMGSLEFHT